MVTCTRPVLWRPVFLKWWDSWSFPEYLLDEEYYSACYFQMFFLIEIGTYLDILRLWWYDITYVIHILVSGVLVTSKWRIWENMSTRQHRLRNEGRKWSLPTRCIQSVAKIIIENNSSLVMANMFRLLCIAFLVTAIFF